MDDFSDDAGKTLAVLHDMQRLDASLPIRLIAMSQNGGPGTARNAAWDVSVQKYIAFLDADDFVAVLWPLAFPVICPSLMLRNSYGCVLPF